MKSLISRTGFGYFPLALIARVPFAMMVVGVLTLVVAARDSIELGGLTSALVGLGVACFGPLIGGLADRYGQRSTLLVTGIVNSVALGFFAWIAFTGLPDWVLLASAFVVGASAPQTSPMSRSRLVTIIQSQFDARERPKTINATLAYESAADEVVFVFGPVIVGVLATFFGAAAPIIGAAVLTLIFVTWFAVHRTATPARTAEAARDHLAPMSSLLRAPLVVTTLGIFAVGLFFGSMLTSLTSFMQDRGAAEQAGLLYGAMGVGSAVLAISVTWFSPKFTLRYRWITAAAVLSVGGIVLQSVQDVPGMLLSLGLLGLGIGPLLVTLYTFGAMRTPDGRSATVMSMLGTAIIVGQAFASAITGYLSENVGTSAALLLPLGSGIFALILGLVNWRLTASTPQVVKE